MMDQIFTGKIKKLSKKNKLRMSLILAQSVLGNRLNMGVYELYFGPQKASEKKRIQNVWYFRIVDKAIIGNFVTLSKKATNGRS